MRRRRAFRRTRRTRARTRRRADRVAQSSSSRTRRAATRARARPRRAATGRDGTREERSGGVLGERDAAAERSVKQERSGGELGERDAASRSLPVVSIVVTGGAGFIGANVCRRLASAGETVIALDDLSTGDVDNLPDFDVTLVEASVLDARALDLAFVDARAVVHLAARPSVPRSIADPMASHLANATGTVEVLEAARRAGNPQIIVASSSSVYGANPTLPKHEDLATLPLSPYGASKLATEAYALAYQESFALPV